MISKNVYDSIRTARSKGEKRFVVLVDPDKSGKRHLEKVLRLSAEAGVDYFFIGGSLLVNDRIDYCLDIIRSQRSIPSIIFPGSVLQMNEKADALLFLSLISGRNPELLIGQQVIAAPFLKKSTLEVIPTGYMLIDGGVPTTVSYMSNTNPIPANKPAVAMCTAVAGELLGLRLIYMDAGSGAKKAISEEMIQLVRESISIPLIIGGGIRTPEKALASVKAGADMIVVGDAIEKDPSLLIEMADAVHSLNPVRSSSEI